MACKCFGDALETDFILLIKNHSISDPFLNMNEIDAEWVGETSWSYRTTFASPAKEGSSVYLLFDGLDTFAKVKLNESVILESCNMFVSHRVDVTNLLKKDNSLTIDFDSALLRGREIKEKMSDHQFVLFNGEAGRLAVRKAQYHWVSLSAPSRTGNLITNVK